MSLSNNSYRILFFGVLEFTVKKDDIVVDKINVEKE